MKLLIVQICPASCHFFFLQSKLLHADFLLAYSSALRMEVTCSLAVYPRRQKSS
jgi:hypothetical protein